MGPYLRCFKVKYLGATNTKGARIKIIDSHRSENNEVFKFVSWDYTKSNGWEIALDYLEKRGIKIVCRGSSNKEDFLLSENFNTDLKELKKWEHKKESY